MYKRVFQVVNWSMCVYEPKKASCVRAILREIGSMGDDLSYTVPLCIVCHPGLVPLETFPKSSASMIKPAPTFNTFPDNADRRTSICSRFRIPRRLPFCTPPLLLFSLYRRMIYHEEGTMVKWFEERDILRSCLSTTSGVIRRGRRERTAWDCEWVSTSGVLWSRFECPAWDGESMSTLSGVLWWARSRGSVWDGERASTSEVPRRGRRECPAWNNGWLSTSSRVIRRSMTFVKLHGRWSVRMVVTSCRV
jgi:hypothetical protein